MSINRYFIEQDSFFPALNQAYTSYACNGGLNKNYYKNYYITWQIIKNLKWQNNPLRN